MTLPYQQQNEINDRYIGTVLYLGDKPFYVYDTSFNVKGLCLSGFLVGDAEKYLEPSVADETLRDGPFNIGYVNKLPYVGRNNKTLYRASYMTRIPKRQWKQGLTSDIIHMSPVPKQPWGEMLKNPMFRDMLQGKYPTFDKAKSLVKGSLTSAAFSRQLAIGKDEVGLFKLAYRGQPVAYSETGKKFKLSEDFTYLRELLDNYGVAA